MALPSPGRIVRAALVIFALLFLPMACWFAYSNFRRYWFQSLALIGVALLFLRWAFDRNDDSWLAAIDELGDR